MWLHRYIAFGIAATQRPGTRIRALISLSKHSRFALPAFSRCRLTVDTVSPRLRSPRSCWNCGLRGLCTYILVVFSPARVFDAADAGDLGSRAIAWWGVPCHDTFKNQVRVDGGRTDVRGVALSLGSASMLGFPAAETRLLTCA